MEFVNDSILGIRLLAPMWSNLASTWVYLMSREFDLKNSIEQLSTILEIEQLFTTEQEKSWFTSASRSSAVSFLPEKDSDI